MFVTVCYLNAAEIFILEPKEAFFNVSSSLPTTITAYHPSRKF
jgi:hypothetical protein